MEQEQVTQEREDKWIRYHDHLKHTPEQWAARYGHLVICGDLRKYSFRDKAFERWVHEAYRILHTEDIGLLRQNLLTVEAIERIQKETDDDF